jgi:hypothetical protein
LLSVLCLEHIRHLSNHHSLSLGVRNFSSIALFAMPLLKGPAVDLFRLTILVNSV